MKAEYASHEMQGLQVFGGVIIDLPYLKMLISPGTNLRRHSGDIIFP
jgi:hypothetical protein